MVIPNDLSERNYTFENWKKMGQALIKIRAAAEKGATAGQDPGARSILEMIEKLEKDTGLKFGS